MDGNEMVSKDKENLYQTGFNPTIKLDRKLIFSSSEKHNLWEFFSNNFLLFKFYPSGIEIEKELESMHKMIKIFENWKSLISAKKMSLIDFCKAIEKFTFHAETQDYRLKAIYKYKSLRKEVDSRKHSLKSDIVNDQIPDLKSETLNQNLGKGCGIEEKLKTRRELALKRRKLLLINRE
ncbi:uncharacterized protein cubi_01071 [Cryptosporidium ubiquitum]|uniref:Uncharacterized protein n=1 Tax=Cryptosporidium ubiquitum TaxID=857276 RepID=A0A1J4MLA3_9CRYT|nr:uncharacterized protein cubi_01071 [Cryptosporidium ubiquitum]OII74227.1 hypothetical protein cubi_01071 [Cryptosporidium ubiquitum]